MNWKQQPASREIVQIRPEMRHRLLEQKRRYKTFKQQFGAKFEQSQDTEYFLLSTKFFQQWVQWTGYDEKQLDKFREKGVQPKNYNSDILEKDPKANQYYLLPGLLENQDFIIIDKDIMSVFDNYVGRAIIRKAYKQANGQKVVEIYKRKFSYFFLNQKITHQIDMKSTRPPELKIYMAEISNYATSNDFKALGGKLYEQKLGYKRSVEEVRIWKVDRDMDRKKYFDYIILTVEKQPAHKYSIQPRASIFENEKQIVQELQITDQDLIIIEVQDKTNSKPWVLKYGEMEQPCQFCRSYKILKVTCGCNKVKYCSDDCRFKDIRYHKRNCSLAQQQEMKEEIDFTFTSNSRKGVAGLNNLGNTCFMNSCLQCLSNSEPLTKYFIEKRYVNQINKTNPIGTKGKLTVKYAKMIKGLWCDSSDSYSPSVLKMAISEFQPMFSGYSQHDSQELLSFLLDGLHEDLNRVLVKPYTESIDSKGRQDDVVAKESWENYLKRNKSIIVDLFMGQYKSKVKCPDCGEESTTFDPYSNISLPIPQTRSFSVDCFVFYCNYSESPKKITIDYKSDSIREWKTNVSNSLRLASEGLKFFILTFESEIEEFNDQSSALYIKDKVDRENKNLFCIELSEYQRKLEASRAVRIDFKFVKIVTQMLISTTKQTATFKRPFYFDKNNLSVQALYLRLFTFLFKPVISRSYRLNSDLDQEQILKQFSKLLQQKDKFPFELYLMTDKVVKKQRQYNSKYVYQKQKLLSFNDNLKELFFENGIQKEFQIQARIHKSMRQDIKKLNTYEDFNKTMIRRRNEEGEDKEYDLVDCLREFKKVQKLQKGNEWYCPKCKQHKQAYKQMSIYKTPKLLIIHLKRFRQKSTLTKEKLISLIKYPLVLDLNEFVANKQLPQAYFAGDQGKMVDESQSSKYELYAVSNHYGGMGGGHYTAYAKNNGTWYDYNDSSVHRVDAKEVVSAAGYMLFYKRI